MVNAMHPRNIDNPIHSPFIARNNVVAIARPNGITALIILSQILSEK